MKRSILTFIAAAVSIAAFADIKDAKYPTPQAEFVQPVYRNASTADLTVIMPDSTDVSTVKVEVYDHEGKEVEWRGYFKVQPGWNTCDIPVAALEDGRHLTYVTAGDTSLKRLLRLETIPEVAAPLGLIEDRRLLFTPDGYMFTSYDGKHLDITFGEPELTCIMEAPGEDALVVEGYNLRRTVDGRFAVSLSEIIYERWLLYSENKRYYQAVADTPEGPYTLVDEVPATEKSDKPAVLQNFGGMNFGRLDPDRRYEFYDPEKHGRYSFNSLFMVQNIEPHDYGCVQAGYRTYWCLATTTTGDTVFLSDKPVFTDVPLYDEDQLDEGFTTNDNFCNAWLSKEGTELYYGRCQTVHRYPPYDLPFDILPNSSRILTLYKTRDGKDWEYVHTFTANGPGEDAFFQQYGAAVSKVSGTDLSLCFVQAYKGLHQQIGIDMVYSRDGVNFYDFNNEKLFVETDDINSWYFGELYTVNDVLEHNGRYYQLINIASVHPHFFADPLFMHSHQYEITGADYKYQFENKRFKEYWPYFDEIGGWEGLGAHGCKHRYFFGVM
ncbi:MAG: hypothetical protein KBT44_01080 [Bacteroidales bacterium]|nr:hypothetical protein [Candidatus Equibacterium intestinale]